MTARLLAAFACPALLLACAPIEGTPDDPSPMEPPVQATPIDLTASLGPDARPSGIAVDPETGERFVLEPQLGIFRLEADGQLTSLWTPTPEMPALTDLCAVGGGRFVAAADGDGYIVDVATGAARQHFCLEPDWDPGFDPDGPVRHVNSSVACDLEAGLIYGQPTTVPAEGDVVFIRHEVASYLLTTGADQQWMPLPDYAQRAGGMTMAARGVLALGLGDTVIRFEAESAWPDADTSLAEHGVRQIEALALSGDTLLVLEADGRLLSLPRSVVPWL